MLTKKKLAAYGTVTILTGLGFAAFTNYVLLPDEGDPWNSSDEPRHSSHPIEQIVNASGTFLIGATAAACACFFHYVRTSNREENAPLLAQPQQPQLPILGKGNCLV